MVAALDSWLPEYESSEVFIVALFDVKLAIAIGELESELSPALFKQVASTSCPKLCCGDR